MDKIRIVKKGKRAEETLRHEPARRPPTDEEIREMWRRERDEKVRAGRAQAMIMLGIVKGVMA